MSYGDQSNDSLLQFYAFGAMLSCIVAQEVMAC